MSPIHELVIFSPSKAFAEDPVAATKQLRKFLSKTKGFISLHAGVAEEEETGYAIIGWETYEDHQAIRKLDGYPHNLGLAPILGDRVDDRKVYHVCFSESPDAALASNSTEILTIVLTEGKTNEDLVQALSVLGPKITAEEGCSKSVAWGETREEPGKFFSFLGWESTKRHYEVVADGSYQTPLANLKAVGDIKMVHVNFKKLLSNV